MSQTLSPYCSRVQMKYSKNEIGKELKLELKKGYDISRISNWAYDLYLFSPDKVPADIDNILQYIFIMEAGSEFIHSEQELWLLAEMLINEEKDPLKQINDLKSKKLS